MRIEAALIPRANLSAAHDAKRDEEFDALEKSRV